MDTFAIFDVGALVNDRHISQLHSKVVSGDLVHLNLSFFNIIGTENDKDGVAPLLSAEKIVKTDSRIYETQHTGR